MKTDSTATKLSPSTETSQANVVVKKDDHYCAGHSPEELQRLEKQAEFLAPSTKDFLERVGITKGMRVLDVGCGCGDVSFLAAELVGETGEVVGFDRAEAAVSTSAARAQAKGLRNVRFICCSADDSATLEANGPFDAIVGRLVVLHLKDPVQAVGRLLRLVRPGGFVGFQEIESLSFWMSQNLETLSKFQANATAITSRGIITSDLTSILVQAFKNAGITNQRIIRSGAIESAFHAREGVYQWIGNMAKLQEQYAGALKVTISGYGSKPFAQQLQEEVESKGASFIPFLWVGAAGRMPSVRPLAD